MTRLTTAIIADDLTGACDAAAPFAARGRPTWVTWHVDNIAESGAEVVSVSTNSRADEPRVAAEKTSITARHIRSVNIERVFKKIDSTLKGNWPQETIAALCELGLDAAVIAPAFPAMGRHITGGQLNIPGESGSAGPSVISILRAHTTLVRYVELDKLRNGPGGFAQLIANSYGTPFYYVVDGTTDEDLDIVAESLELLGDRVLPVGSAGLAAAIARRERRQSLATTQPAPAADESESPTSAPSPSSIIMFTGSSNPRTAAQLKALMETRQTSEFTLDDASPAGLINYIKNSQLVVIHVKWGQQAAVTLDSVFDACQRAGSAGFVLTGGDTAQFVCDRCAARGIRIAGEIETGIPWGRLSGGPLAGLPVATKAGGFGDDNALVRSVSFLERAATRSASITTTEQGQ